MYTQSKSQSSKSAPKPFCKVCKDAGKSEAEFNSHFVKSEPGVKGVVICPTLLSQECTYCHRAGHTVGYCKVLQKFKKTKDAENRARKYVPVPVVIPKAKANSIFDVLAESDEEPKAKITQQVRKVEEYPVLSTSMPTTKLALPVTKATYANMAAKPMPIEVENETYAITTPTIAHYVEKAYTNTFIDYSKKPKNWADWSDSDEE